jgi:hypothetical protein
MHAAHGFKSISSITVSAPVSFATMLLVARHYDLLLLQVFDKRITHAELATRGLH